MQLNFVPWVYLNGKWRVLTKYSVVASDITEAKEKIKRIMGQKKYSSLPSPKRIMII
jgi:hypothetical protein